MHPIQSTRRVIKAVGDIDTGGPEGRAILVSHEYYDDGTDAVVPQRPERDPKGFIFATEQHANEIAARKEKYGE